MESRRAYAADREVIDACRAQGFEVTARQLERWRPFLPERDVEHVKGIRGSRTTSVPGYVEAVIAIAEALRAGLPLRRVPLALFARGLPVRAEVLKTAYLDLLRYVTHEIRRIGADEDSGSYDPDDIADVLAIRITAHGRRDTTFPWAAKRAEEAARQAEEAVSGRSLLAGAWSAALTGPVTGMPASDAGITEALTVFGLNDGQDPRHVADHLALFTFSAISEAIQSATLEQWNTAREDLAAMKQPAGERRQAEARLFPEAQQLVGLDALSTSDPVYHAAFIAGLLVVANDEWRQNLRSELARWEAMNKLLSMLPKKFDRFLLQEQPTDEVLRELRPILIEWAAQHPAEASLLNTEPDQGAPQAAAGL
jgi:hypothetical protein